MFSANNECHAVTMFPFSCYLKKYCVAQCADTEKLQGRKAEEGRDVILQKSYVGFL